MLVEGIQILIIQLIIFGTVAMENDIMGGGHFPKIIFLPPSPQLFECVKIRLHLTVSA